MERFKCLIVLSVIIFGSITDSRSQTIGDLIKEVFYISTSGNDGQSGSKEYPWATWQKGFSRAGAGDTVYIRGGVYYADNEDEYGVMVSNKKAESYNPICILNFPGETPILDCSKINQKLPVRGIALIDCENIYIQGLTLRGVKQNASDSEALGFYFKNGGPYIVKNCISYNNEGAGFSGFGVDSIKLIQCDSFNNFDVANSDYLGGQADGFAICFSPSTSYTYYKECRSWYNSDDGFDCWKNEGTVVFEKCWAFSNGRYQGDGSGFKLGRTDLPGLPYPHRVLTNCLAFYNKFIGFDQNGGKVSMVLLDNIAYQNGSAGYLLLQQTNQLELKRNISYKNGAHDFLKFSSVECEVNNRFNNQNINDSSFFSLDSIGVSSARNLDGSLPKLDFLKTSAR